MGIQLAICDPHDHFDGLVRYAPVEVRRAFARIRPVVRRRDQMALAIIRIDLLRV